MIDGQGRARITDFGLAALAGEVGQDDVRSRDAGLHGARAARGPLRVDRKRHLLAGPRPLRALHREERLAGRDARRADAPPRGRPVAPVEPRRRPRPGRGARDPALPRDAPGRAPGVGARRGGGAAGRRSAGRGARGGRDAVARDGRGGRRAWAPCGPPPPGARSPPWPPAPPSSWLFLGPTKIMGHVPLPKEPAVLVAEAKAILRAAGQSGAPADEAWGFRSNDRYLEHLEEEKEPRPLERLGSGPRSGLLFWYRRSPWPLVPVDAVSHRMSPDDPPNSRPGMSIVWLDTEGRLVTLETVPPEAGSRRRPRRPSRSRPGTHFSRRRGSRRPTSSTSHCDGTLRFTPTGELPGRPLHPASRPSPCASRVRRIAAGPCRFA